MSGDGSKRGLGRGLSALLGDLGAETASYAPAVSANGVRMVAIGEIRPHPGQPRRHFDEDALDELAQSIAARGVLQPIIVRTVTGGFEIVAGERRWRAAQRARLHEMPVLVREADESTAFELAIIENIQREDLNAIEEAEAYQRLIGEFGHSKDALARFVNKSRSHVSNLLRLLDLPADVRMMVANGGISMGHARALVTAGDPAELAQDVVRRGLSVRATERLARNARPDGAARTPRRRAASPDADIEALERQLSDMLGLAVAIEHGGDGGRVAIAYSSLDQLDMICQRLTGEGI